LALFESGDPRVGEFCSAALPTPANQFAAMPNFYFHVTTAYNILRHNGLQIGKTDYIGNRYLWTRLCQEYDLAFQGPVQ